MPSITLRSTEKRTPYASGQSRRRVVDRRDRYWLHCHGRQYGIGKTSA